MLEAALLSLKQGLLPVSHIIEGSASATIKYLISSIYQKKQSLLMRIQLYIPGMIIVQDFLKQIIKHYLNHSVYSYVVYTLLVDAKFLLKQHGKVSYLDTLETMEADIKTSGFTGILLECKQNQLEQHAKRIGKIMRIRAVEPSGNHSLSDALFALNLYSDKKDLVGMKGDEKATAANLCNEVCDVLLSRTTDLHAKKQSLVALTSSKRYQCLKTSRIVGRQFLNQLWGKALFFLAAVKWVITGSYHWRTDGASKRKNLEIAVANNSFSVIETIQTNKQTVGVNALAAAA